MGHQFNMTACVFSKQALYAFVSNAYLFWFSMGEKKAVITSITSIKRATDRQRVTGAAAEERASVEMSDFVKMLFLHVAKCLTRFASGTRSWYFPTQWFVLMWLTWKNLYTCEFIQKNKLNYRSPGESKFEVIGDATKYSELFYFTIWLFWSLPL